MLRWRLLSATVIISTFIGLLYVDHQYPLLGVTGLWLLPFCFVVAMLATNEVLAMLDAKHALALHWPAYVGTAAVFIAACTPVLWQAYFREPYPTDCALGPFGWPLAAFAASVIGIFVVEIVRFREPGNSIAHIGMSTFAVAYVGLNLTFVVGLRLFGTPSAGLAALISMIFIAKMSDAGAYTFGRLFGRTKLAPALSPGKTIEGSVGGLVTGCLCSIVFFTIAVPWLFGTTSSVGNVVTYAIYGLVVGVAGMMGDLAESLLKRDSQLKDSSTWLPGLGGVMDVMDSLLFAALPAYLCWLGQLVGL